MSNEDAATAPAAIRFLHHPTSQPCRAVHQLMLENDIPFEEVIVNLMDGENETAVFKATYNPTGQVPILVDGDFNVWESAAIGFYLNERFDLPGNWLGRDMRQRAVIQQYTHFHSTMLRRGAGAFFYTRFAECIWGPRDYSAEIAMGRYMLAQSMPIMEEWLGRHAYLYGDEISFADLLACHEFVSHEAGAIIPDEEWAKFPRLRAWFEGLMTRPHAQAVSTMIMEVGAMRQAGQLIPMTRRTSLAKGTSVTPGLPA